MLTTMWARQVKGWLFLLFIYKGWYVNYYVSKARQVKGWLFLLFIYKGWYVNHYVSKANLGLAGSIIYL